MKKQGLSALIVITQILLSVSAGANEQKYIGVNATPDREFDCVATETQPYYAGNTKTMCVKVANMYSQPGPESIELLNFEAGQCGQNNVQWGVPQFKEFKSLSEFITQFGKTGVYAMSRPAVDKLIEIVKSNKVYTGNGSQIIKINEATSNEVLPNSFTMDVSGKTTYSCRRFK